MLVLKIYEFLKMLRWNFFFLISLVDNRFKYHYFSRDWLYFKSSYKNFGFQVHLFENNGNKTYLESNSGNITNSVTFTTETGNKNFIILFNIIQRTITGYESCNFLSIFDKLNPNAFTNSWIRLFSFNSTKK